MRLVPEFDLWSVFDSNVDDETIQFKVHNKDYPLVNVYIAMENGLEIYDIKPYKTIKYCDFQ